MRFRYTIMFIPATVFWVASMVFFIIGMSIGDTSNFTSFFTSTYDPIMFYVAIGLAISNTIIQILGNSSDSIGEALDELGLVLFIGWIASYVLGVSSNVYALSLIMRIPYAWIEWPICIALGAMIEFMPERMWVLSWREVFGNGMPFVNKLRRNNNRPSNNNRYSTQNQLSPSERAEMERALSERAQTTQSAQNAYRPQAAPKPGSHFVGQNPNER